MQSQTKCALFLLLGGMRLQLSHSAVPCNSTHNPCEVLLWKGSECKHGYCTNPFQGGCLRTMLDEDGYAEKYEHSNGNDLRLHALNVLRVCNSEDPVGSSFCQPNFVDGYSEVRMFQQNWESAMATSWILQILLSELLGVPSSIELGLGDDNNNFYNEENRMDYGLPITGDRFMSLQNAFDAEGGDCTIYTEQNSREEDKVYVPCAHHVPEMWQTGQILIEKQTAGVLEPTRFSGAIGDEGWYVTRFTIEKDPSLGFYLGYQGEINREKLANTFKRPTTWKEYCTLISANNCSIPDDVVTRAPTVDEEPLYFVEGSYTGFFRATDKNNCTIDAGSCTGHFIDYPCGWTSYFKQQAYHLDIALVSEGNDQAGGFAYSDIVQILSAANATKSDIILQWWKPDATFNSFLGLDSELIEVTLPVETDACVKAREYIADQRCISSENMGDPVGACGEASLAVRKVTVGNMESNIKESKKLIASMSPAYDFINNFQMSELQLDLILKDWSARGIDKYGFDLRLTACTWVADNLENIHRFIPNSYPRAYTEDSRDSPQAKISIAAMVVSASAIAVTVITAVFISGMFKCQIFSTGKVSLKRRSQIEFVYLLLAGLFLVPVGALLMASQPSNGTCISSIWFLNVGYTLVLVPTLVRVSAIVAIIQAGKKCKRVSVDKKKLVKISLGICALAAIFCALWSGIDPPTAQKEVKTSQEKNDFGDVIVTISYYCESQRGVWLWISFIGQSILLVGGSFLAFQLREAPKGVNDSKELAFMLYSSSMFLVLRIVLYLVAGQFSADSSITKGSLQNARSLLWSIDSVVNTCTYFSTLFRKKTGARQSTTISGIHVSSQPSYLPSSVHGSNHVNGTVKGGKYAEEEKQEEGQGDNLRKRCSVCGSLDGSLGNVTNPGLAVSEPDV